ncbi:MAG: hypothetical protein U1F68_00230 [Gammaproteobacteria bacterium]
MSASAPFAQSTMPHTVTVGKPMTPHRLIEQNQRFQGRGGVSAENRDAGFRPAFIDTATGAIYLSRFADGRPAPMHLLDGLPPELVIARFPSGRVAAAKDSVVAGFVRAGRFYTRDQAAAAMLMH